MFLGKWDCFVSGGLAVGYGILETTIKEAAEEASVEGELVKKLVPAGCVRYNILLLTLYQIQNV